MAQTIDVTVPLSAAQTMALLLRAAEALRHYVVAFDPLRNRAEINVDFDFRSFATYRIEAAAAERCATETALRLVIRPKSRLTPWTGFRQSHRIGWRLVGKMEEILDPERYRSLAVSR
jgi:hypothetical protein